MTLESLQTPHRRISEALGAHQIQCTATLSSSIARGAGKQPRRQEVKLQVSLSVDDRGAYAARKQTHPQYGQEAVWVDGWLYSRHRHSRFVRRRPRRGETAQRLDELYGLLPAQVELLAPFVGVRAASRAKHLGRRGVGVKLSLDPAGKAQQWAGVARRWRRGIVVEALDGSALIDADTGVPLSVDLEARWRFFPPAAAAKTGIPNRSGQRASGTMKLSLRQRLTKIGKDVGRVTAPPSEQVLADPRRLRVERERQFVTGELPMPEHWPRVEPLAEPGRRR